MGTTGKIGNTREAMTHFERAVDIRRNTGTLHGAGGAHLLANVGALKVEKADYQGAMKVFMEALVIRETAGELHTHEGATLLKMLAEAEHAAGKKNCVRGTLRASLPDPRESQTRGHPSVSFVERCSYTWDSKAVGHAPQTPVSSRSSPPHGDRFHGLNVPI